MVTVDHVSPLPHASEKQHDYSQLRRKCFAGRKRKLKVDELPEMLQKGNEAVVKRQPGI